LFDKIIQYIFIINDKVYRINGLHMQTTFSPIYFWERKNQDKAK
jgi:hypothetical protein